MKPARYEARMLVVCGPTPYAEMQPTQRPKWSPTRATSKPSTSGNWESSSLSSSPGATLPLLFSLLLLLLLLLLPLLLKKEQQQQQ